MFRLLSAMIGAVLVATIDTSAIRSAEPIDFAHQIVPILRTHCGACHTGDQKKGGFSLNTRADLLEGGESGDAVVIGKSNESELVARTTTDDPDLRMPPEGKRLSSDQIALLKKWIDAGLPWEEGFSFRPPSYEPPLKPRQVQLPQALDGRTNPVDRILDTYLAVRNRPLPQPIDDAAFARRASLDLVGLLPTAGELEAYLSDGSPEKRAKFVDRLLNDRGAYAEHWLTFWNDLLRNDYAGTGFITGGRSQISRWLYDALATNMPFDQFARELIAPPTSESAGYAAGIKWRGDVSAGQTVEIQFAQSLGQTFLGINLKCASCHDSFIDRWKLEESYGLAAIYATRPLEIHRCDKPVGKQAEASWLFPELGQVNADAPQPERLQQLAALLTHKDNGRFTRTIVNRLWHRLMGRGIVHPTDAMQSEPWSADLLDFLADDFARHGYDLKHTLRLIAKSTAYQSRAEAVPAAFDEADYVYAGPRAKRLTAEQFVDTVWQLTGAGPKYFDAPILRGTVDPQAAATETLIGCRITFDDKKAAAGTFRRDLKIDAPRQAVAVLSADCDVSLMVNGKQVTTVAAGKPSGPIVLTPHLRQAANTFLLIATNPKNKKHPPQVYFEARIQRTNDKPLRVATDDEWEWTKEKPDTKGRFVAGKRTEKKEFDVTWQPVAVAKGSIPKQLLSALLQGSAGADVMVRASLMKSDFLMRSLGRPNRDQIVSVRPAELTTLEAIDLSNGQTLADALTKGAPHILAEHGSRPEKLVEFIFESALSRKPTPSEQTASLELLGNKPTAQSVEDLLWAVLMLPEFMLVR